MSKSKSKSALSMGFVINALGIRNILSNDGPNVVNLLIYDMGKGITRIKSLLQLFQVPVEEVWHAAVYVFGREWGYSSKGVREFPPINDRELCDSPESMERIGETAVSFQDFKEFLEELSTGPFRARNYDILNHNCIIFSQVLCKFLCGESIPKYLLELPKTFRRQLLIKLSKLTDFPGSFTDCKLGPDTIADRIEDMPASQIRDFLRDLNGTN